MRDDAIRQQLLLLYRNLFDHAPDATIVADKEGQVLLLNRAAQDLPEELVERLFDDAGPRAHELAPFREEMRGAGHASVELRLGSRALRAEGRSFGSERIVVMRDVTNERRLEAELRALHRVESSSYLTASIGPPPPSVVDRVNVSEAVHGRRTLLERVTGASVQVSVSIDTNAGSAVLDRELLDQSLIYLAANAREAMPTGGHMTVCTSSVTLEGASAGTYVAVIVSDTGAGMSLEARDRIFEPFLATTETDRRGRGPVLRLAAVRRFVAQSGGFVAVHSRPGCGTTVVLYFPRVVETEAISMVRLTA
jgi:PAS domain S-box-containing protein